MALMRKEEIRGVFRNKKRPMGSASWIKTSCCYAGCNRIRIATTSTIVAFTLGPIASFGLCRRTMRTQPVYLVLCGLRCDTAMDRGNSANYRVTK
jgi:hypothetical protein